MPRTISKTASSSQINLGLSEISIMTDVYFWLFSPLFVIRLSANFVYKTSRTDFTITVEIHAHSLVNFYGQYADRHMNLKFMRCLSEREREIRQFVIIKNKLMPVFNAPVLLLTMNFVITLSK